LLHLTCLIVRCSLWSEKYSKWATSRKKTTGKQTIWAQYILLKETVFFNSVSSVTQCLHCCIFSALNSPLLQPLALNEQFTTNGMCTNNNTHIYVAQRSNNRVIAAHYLYCFLLPQCEALRNCCSGFTIATTHFPCLKS